MCDLLLANFYTEFETEVLTKKQFSEKKTVNANGTSLHKQCRCGFTHTVWSSGAPFYTVTKLWAPGNQHEFMVHAILQINSCKYSQNVPSVCSRTNYTGLLDDCSTQNAQESLNNGAEPASSTTA